MADFDPRLILARLRDGEVLSAAELQWFAQGLASGAVSDEQAGAFAMAVLLNKLSDPERVSLTLAMRDSGDVLRWDLPGPAIDKHSTGGVGDAVSLVLAPALAAMGAYVPMISGRGLGHTGGTLDKLEAIPGLKSEVSEARFREIVSQVGCAVVSATGAMAPADKRLYAIRDVTGTVESIDLITASILSKKLAAGLDALILDVKCGSGAFMKTPDEARALAQSLVQTANGAGCKTAALITDMNQPCCPSLGNALEIMEVMEALTSGDASGLLCDLTCHLGGELLVLSGQASEAARAGDQLRATIADGSAAERFGRMVFELGGPADFVENWADRLPAAPVVRDICAGRAGFVRSMDGMAMGNAVVHLGGGRLRAGAKIDASVGFSEVIAHGANVEKDTVLCRVHAASTDAANRAEAAILAAIEIGEAAPVPLPLIHEAIHP
ncbi:MAG: thymidine phosphorylase [Paracoccaceae bacterium]